MKRTPLFILLSVWLVLTSSIFLLPTNIHGQGSGEDEYVVNLPLIMTGSNVGSEGLTPSEFERKAIELTNLRRVENGCPALTTVPELIAAARGHSADMADQNYFSHNSLDGKQPWDRMQEAGYTDFLSAGENIAAGYITPEAVVEAWLNSPGHRKNMLNCNFNEIGIGYVLDADSTFKHYWTQDLGQR